MTGTLNCWIQITIPNDSNVVKCSSLTDVFMPNHNILDNNHTCFVVMATHSLTLQMLISCIVKYLVTPKLDQWNTIYFTLWDYIQPNHTVFGKRIPFCFHGNTFFGMQYHYFSLPVLGNWKITPLWVKKYCFIIYKIFYKTNFSYLLPWKQWILWCNLFLLKSMYFNIWSIRIFSNELICFLILNSYIVAMKLINIRNLNKECVLYLCFHSNCNCWFSNLLLLFLKMSNIDMCLYEFSSNS